MLDLFELFTKVAEKNINNIAIKFSDKEKITYKNLINKILRNSKIIDHLIDESKINIACIESDKSINTYILILSLIKLKIPYFFLYPDMPISRKKTIINTAKPTIYFYETSKSEIKISKSYKIDNLYKKRITHNIKKKKIKEKRSNDVYYMFTSGSTGIPKGVIINNTNLLYFIDWAIEEFNYNNKTIHAGLNQIYFDNSIFDFFITLFSGGTLVPIKASELKNPYNVIKKIKKNKCNKWFSVPTLIIYLLKLKIFNKKNLPNLEHIIFGGEPFFAKNLRNLFNNFGRGLRYSNVYGPTETTCMCSNYDLNKNDILKIKNFPPIGFLNKYFNGFLWDGKRENKKIGELVLTGPCVGQGYLKYKKKIHSGFNKNPVNKNYDEKAYFTGDIMKLDKEGKLHFIGRKDNQIKHNGYRIELEEIETKLKKYNFIEDIIIKQKFDNDNSYLYSAIIKSKKYNERNFYNFMLKALPKYMYINKFKYFDKFPKNKNGKINRKMIKI